jgi:hypothetical protein
MASTLEWSDFFTQRYSVQVDGVHAHDADLRLTVRNQYCMRASMVPIGATGSGDGFFHLVDHQCHDHLGNYQKTGPLQGSVMECRYAGKHGERGYFRVGFWEEPPFPPDRMVFGIWHGSLFIEHPRREKKALVMRALMKKKRPDDNYPWNR